MYLDVFTQYTSQGMRPSVFIDRLGLGLQPLEKLLRKMEYIPETKCWRWTKAVSHGYGVVRMRKLGIFTLVHRLCYELVNGPVPEGRHVHHRVEAPIHCIGPMCCNPDHTLAVTPREHISLTPECPSNIAANRDCCEHGHPYTPENTRRTKSGKRVCRECHRIWYWERRVRLEGNRPKGRWRPEKRKTVCVNGHPLVGDNVYYFSTAKGIYQACRECRKQAVIKNRKKAKE